MTAWWDEPQRAAVDNPAADTRAREPVAPLEDWLEARAPAAARAPEPAARPVRRARASADAIPAVDAWLIFRTTEDGEGGPRDVVEHLRVVRGRDLNRLRPGEPRDFDWDVPFLGPDDRDAQAAWSRFMRSWRFSDRVEVCEQLSKIEGLEWLGAQCAWARGEK